MCAEVPSVTNLVTAARGTAAWVIPDRLAYDQDGSRDDVSIDELREAVEHTSEGPHAVAMEHRPNRPQKGGSGPHSPHDFSKDRGVKGTRPI